MLDDEPLDEVLAKADQGYAAAQSRMRMLLLVASMSA
jgi:hypothetical protein